MKRTFLLFLTIIIFQIFTFAQTQPAKSTICPIFSLSSSEPVIPGNNITFTLKIDQFFDGSKLKLLWSVEGGEIVSGQDSILMTARQSANVGTILLAKVEIHGLPNECGTPLLTASTVPFDPPTPMAVEEYRKITAKEEKDLLNKYATQLQNYPTAIGFITKSFTQNALTMATYQDLQRILKHLESRKVYNDRIMFGVNYGKEEKTTLFVVPPGARHPNVDGEVLDAKKIAEKLKVIKANIKKRVK